eukprot:TRINITY_DN66642_c0_g1_i1.p1 TRINITY_DN66642_c0_g1~~TRINITY_DN66642_c0_g1_i1.p1  ORF type:complete len:342 (+),score=116.25 TRINITY_DN66642_c0_g1_i1:39-1028(+)
MRRCAILFYKKAVDSTYAAAPKPGESRFWGLVAGNYCAQLTTYNTGPTFEEKPVVHTELAAVAVDEDDKGLSRDIVFVTPKGSQSEEDLKTGGLCSLMYGSANPQIMHFFNQLEAKCWTSTITGRGELLDAGEGGSIIFATHFAENPYLVGVAKQQQQQGPSAAGSRNYKVLRNQLKDEEEEGDDGSAPSLDSYSLWRLKQENGFLGRPDGGLDKQSVLTLPKLDPLGSVNQRWVTRINFRRDILTEGIRTAYSIPIINPWAFHIDCKGFYVMGQTEDDPTWREFFLEWGPNMVFDEPRQVKTWWQEFVDQANVSYDNVTVGKPDDLTR